MAWLPPSVAPDTDLRACLPEDDWRAAIAAIASRHGGDGAALAPYATGSDIVWSVGDLVVKLTDPSWAWQIDAEADWLERVAGRLPLATPRLVARGELEGWPYVVVTRLEGVALAEVWPRLPHGERRRLAVELGRVVRALHDVPTADAPRTWTSFWPECLERARTRDRDDPELPPGAEHLAAAVGPLLDELTPLDSEPHVAVHTELLGQHLLVDTQTGRPTLCGLIDFADARVGSHEYDFGALVEFVFRGEPGLLGTFLRAYGYAPRALDVALSRRLAGFALAHRYGRLSRWLAFRGAVPASLDELVLDVFDVDPDRRP